MIFLRVALPFIAGFFVSYMYRAVNAVLGPTLAAEFGLSAGGLGLLTSMYFLSFALFQLPLGLLLDRFGPRRVNATLLLVAAAGGTWFAFAHSAAEAIAARALIGLGVSGCLMSTVLAFVLWYPAERLATMNGIAFAVGALGSITVSVPLELLLRVWPWREAFMLLVGATLAVSLTLWFWVPERSARPSGASLADQLRGLGEADRGPGLSPYRARHGGEPGRRDVAADALDGDLAARRRRLRAARGRARAAGGERGDDRRLPGVRPRRGPARAARAQRAAAARPAGWRWPRLSLALLALGTRTGSLLLWCTFVGGSTAIVLSFSLLSRRYPKEMVGRANTGINVFGFSGMFLGQWGLGAVLDLWPQSAAGYAPEAYTWALGIAWAIQFAAWSGSGAAGGCSRKGARLGLSP